MPGKLIVKVVGALIGVTALVAPLTTGVPEMSAQSTPVGSISCDDFATPTSVRDSMEHGAMASPAASMEFDQMYIDMMIPHHASIVALSQAAAPLLTDERLRTLAENIIDAQTAEIDELRGYREQFYGSAEPMPMDEMMAQMDAEAQVAAFCAASDPDLAFIDLIIPHHQSAIVASEAALQQATHDEIRIFAERVIEDQQREIDELSAIRQELYGSATPAPVSHGGPVVDQVSFIDALRAQGLTVEVFGPLQQPFLQPQAGTVLRVSGGSLTAPTDIQVYEYADAAMAEADAAQIGPDGNPPTVIIEWVAPPHFYQAGRIIVLYVGDDPAVLDVLTQVVGPQFAGQ